MDCRRQRRQAAERSAARQRAMQVARQNIFFRLATCSLLALASGAQAAPYVEFFEWLPVLEVGDGRSGSRPADINSAGVVIGSSNLAGTNWPSHVPEGIPGTQVFRWDGTLTIISPDIEGSESNGVRINNTGDILGFTQRRCTFCEWPQIPTWIWDGGIRSLGALEPAASQPFDHHDPLAIEEYNTGTKQFFNLSMDLNDASVAVGTAQQYGRALETILSTGQHERVAWIAPAGGTMQLLPFPDGVQGAGDPLWHHQGVAINNYGDLLLSGTVIDTESRLSNEWRYFVTTDGAELALPNNHGPGLRINDRLQVLFRDGVVFDIKDWTEHSLQDAEYVGPSSYRIPRGGFPLDINDSGWVVGTLLLNPYEDQSPLGGFLPSHAFVWQDDVVYELGQLLSASPFAAELGAGFLGSGTAIADEGWITGWGRAPGDDPAEINARGFRLKLGADYYWAEAVDGLFSDGHNWVGNSAPSNNIGAFYDVPGAYTVSFDEAAAHGGTAILAGDVAFALGGNTYDLQSLSVQSTDNLPVYARVVGRLDFEDGISVLPLPDGRLTTQEAFVGPRGTLANAGTLLVGDVFLQDYETPATRDGTDVDLHVVDRLRIATGGTVTGSGLEYGAIVDGEGDTGRVEIEGLNASMNSFRIDVGGVHGGRIDVAGGGLLESRTALVVGAEGDGAAEVRVSGFAVDFDGRIVNSAVEASLIALGDVNLVRVDERSGALWAYDRGRVSADDILVGVSAGTRGEFDVRGEGTRVGGLVTSHTLLEVGYGGEGLMVIRDGAQVFANTTIGGFRTPPGDFEIGSGVIPDPEIGAGAVFITGQGADTPDAFNTLLDSPLLLVGDTGLGELVISDGARVLSNRILLGQYITGEGSVTVQGAGSLLELSFEGADEDIDFDFPAPELWVGKAGKGALLVRDGGSVVIDPFNAGVIHVEDGRIEIRNGGSVTSGAVNIGPDAVVVGDAGSWNVAEGHTMLHGGRFEIGASPGRFLIDGNLTLLDTSVLEIEFAGLAPGLFDTLDITGDLRLGGTLALSFIDDFVPQPDDVFNFLNVGGLVEGSFDQVLTYNLALGLDYDFAWNDGELQMRMQQTNGVTPIPIPPAGWFLMSACGLLAVFRRGNVQKFERV